MNKQEIEKAINNLKDIKRCEIPYGRLWKMCEVSILALEKQIPKKPIEVTDEKGWEDWACPECRVLIEGGSVMLHCWNCGKKLDWSVKDE